MCYPDGCSMRVYDVLKKKSICSQLVGTADKEKLSDQTKLMWQNGSDTRKHQTCLKLTGPADNQCFNHVQYPHLLTTALRKFGCR